MLRYLPKKKRHRILIAILFLAVIIALVDQFSVWYGRRITIDKSTTYITAPIVDGYPDYLAALNGSLSKGITPDNNAAPLILEIVGTGDAPPAAVNALYKTWGLPVPTTPPLFVDYPDWVKKQSATQPTTRATDDNALWDEVSDTFKKPQSTPDNPQLDRWLQASASALAVLHLAADHSQFLIPAVTDGGLTASPTDSGMFHVHLFVDGRFRELTNAALARAMIRLKHHDQKGFDQGILDNVRLAHLLAHQPCLIEDLIAVAIDSAAMQTLQQAAATNLLDAAHLRYIREGIDAAGPLPTFARSFNIFERFTALDCLCSMRRIDTGAIPIFYNSNLRQINRFYDRVAAAYDLPTYARREEETQKIGREVITAAPASPLQKALHPTAALLAVLLPDLGKTSELHTAYLVERDLALTALQLRLHKLSAGSFPTALADLKSPTFTPPLDRFTDAPLIYRKKADGYILYSVGYDLKDDGGTPRDEHTGKNYDIVVQASQ